MRIAAIETIIVDLPTRRPHHLAMATINSQGRVLVRVRDEEGREGIGEAPVIPHYGAETVEGIKLVIDDYLVLMRVAREGRQWLRRIEKNSRHPATLRAMRIHVRVDAGHQFPHCWRPGFRSEYHARQERIKVLLTPAA
jgi:L-alanine-DL-glutamate epimerase-like enolase superfamily enzyme